MQVPESTWEAYYKERAALDFRYSKQSTEADSDAEAEDEENQAPANGGAEQDADEQGKGKGKQAATKAGTWQHDWPQPQLRGICTECYSDNASEELRTLTERMKKGLARTISGCSNLPSKDQLKKTIKSSFYIVSYWWVLCRWSMPCLALRGAA